MSSSNQKILLVEDDKYQIAIYTTGLERAGYSVLHTTHLKETLEKIKEEKPNLVLLDIVLERQESGLDILKAIKQDPSLQSTKVVMLTNFLGENIEADCKKAGALDYLAKDIYSPSELGQKIKEYLEDSN